MQEKYYTVSGGVGSGYFHILLKYVQTLMGGYVTKLKKIHDNFDPKMLELFKDKWSEITSDDQDSFTSIRNVLGTQTFDGKSDKDGDGVFSRAFIGNEGENTILSNIVNVDNNNQRITVNYGNSTNTDDNKYYGYIHKWSTDLYNRYLKDNRYKNALLAITTYCGWKEKVRGLISDNKGDFDTSYNAKFNVNLHTHIQKMMDSMHTKIQQSNNCMLHKMTLQKKVLQVVCGDYIVN